MVLSKEQLFAVLSHLDPLIYLIPAIWLTFLISWVLPLNRFGLVPREFRGMFGIVSMPFLHQDFKHLISNTVPLALLLALLFNTTAGATKVVVLTQLSGGGLLWLVGRRANHIGASLMVFALTGFHITTGLVQVKLSTVAIAVLVAALYGSTFLTSINPLRRGSSWDGHLCGFLGGAGIAVFFTTGYYTSVFG